MTAVKERYEINKMEKGTTNPIEENIMLVRHAFETRNVEDLSNDNNNNNNNRPDYVNPLSQGFRNLIDQRLEAQMDL
jgi:hypothetical protein